MIRITMRKRINLTDVDITKVKNTRRQYYQNHKEQYRETSRKYRERLRFEVLEHLGNKCVRCGFSDPRALQIDHVYGNGRKEHVSLGLGNIKGFYDKVLADAEGNYQLLCANCNWIKRHENQETRLRNST